jgi:RNA polymerase sigma-70 factor, ECF subfamily
MSQKASFRVVPRPGQEPPDCETKTLADVLFAKRAAKTRVPESDWVELVDKIVGRDQGALHALYSQTHRMVFTLIMRITGNRETAEELTLDVFHDVWRRASAYDPAGGSVIGWIMNQARSRAIDRVRFEHRKKRVGEPGVRPVDAAAADGPYEAVQIGELDVLLRNALQLLTPDERQAIETAFFSELTYGEAAQQLNQPLGTVKTRIRSGLAKLREALAGKVEP